MPLLSFSYQCSFSLYYYLPSSFAYKRQRCRIVVVLQNNEFFFDSANTAVFFFSEWNILCIFAAVFVLRRSALQRLNPSCCEEAGKRPVGDTEQQKNAHER